MTKADPQDLSRDDLTLTAAFLIALAATLGALFIGEVLGQMPCTLCWYQRIAMFPLVPILGLSLWRGDGTGRTYACLSPLPGWRWRPGIRAFTQGSCPRRSCPALKMAHPAPARRR